MYIGDIPGMYFDKEKKKYFSIQADRNTTSSASKYSQSHVLREERQVKRQKLQDDRRSRARSQTVTHAAIIQNSIAGGAGLSREISHRPLAHNQTKQRQVTLEGLRPHRVQVFDPDAAWPHSISDIQVIPDANLTIFVRPTGGFFRTTLYIGASDWLLQSYPQGRIHLPKSTKGWSNPCQISALECTTIGNRSFVLLCDTGGSWSLDAVKCAEAEDTRGDGTVGPIGDDLDQPRLPVQRGLRGEYMNEAFWDAKFQPGVSQPSFALAGWRRVSLVDAGVHRIHNTRPAGNTVEVSLPLAAEMEATALAWLDPRTLAIAMVPFPKAPLPHASSDSGQKTGRRKKQSSKKQSPLPDPQLCSEVRLWDIRSRDSSSRILPSSRLTGLSSIPLPSTSPSISTTESPNPHYILTTSTSGISMHDLRFTPKDSPTGTTRPLWTAAHASQTPRLPLAVHAGLDVVAVVDRDDVVQCYSLANGMRAGSLRCATEDGDRGWGDMHLGVPRWQEDRRGAPYLCVGGRHGWVHSWKW